MGQVESAWEKARAMARLVRWLGPWADPERKPRGVARKEVLIRHGFRAWNYQRTDDEPRGTYLISPGLHFLGPEDPRVDRFCTILAAAGFRVLAPFLPTYTGMRIAPSVITELEEACEWLLENGCASPAVFSISFGSLPALRLAANSRIGPNLSHLICFGGFADLAQTLEFCISGADRDPLNQPAAFISLLDYIDEAPSDRASLVQAWRAYMEMTWGREEMKDPSRHQPIADRIAASLDTDLREFFLIGTGHRAGALAIARRGLKAMGQRADFFDPRPHLGSITCPVTIVHGRDDDVIDVGQAQMLADAFPPGADVEVILTGLYSHSRPTQKLRSLAGEGRSMLAMLRALVR